MDYRESVPDGVSRRYHVLVENLGTTVLISWRSTCPHAERLPGLYVCVKLSLECSAV